MISTWQDLVAMGIVALALAYLGRLVLTTFVRKQAGSCATGCGKCSARQPREASQVITIGIPGTSSSRTR